MKRKIIPLILSVLIPLMSTFVFAGEFKITRVSDGDTVKAEGHDIEIKVRFVGIDAPETSKKKRDPGQPFSQKAKEHLADLILYRTVDMISGTLLALLTHVRLGRNSYLLPCYLVEEVA